VYPSRSAKQYEYVIAFPRPSRVFVDRKARGTPPRASGLPPAPPYSVTSPDGANASKKATLFGVFSLATLVAGGVTTLSGPLSNALLPRLTELAARGHGTQFIELYRNATQFTAVLAFSAALFLAIFSKIVLWVWTGNPAIAAGASMTLTLYALGNGVAAFGAFPYYLQYAKGDVRLHLVGTILFLAVLVPSVVALTLKFGAIGAGAAWLGTHSCFLLIWVPYVHHRFFPQFHLAWMGRDIASIALVTALTGLAARFLLPWPDSRVGAGAMLLGYAALSVVVAGAASSFVRDFVLARARRFRDERRLAGG
jgi:O-antigen/teichoic acid export membrane protein